MDVVQMAERTFAPQRSCSRCRASGLPDDLDKGVLDPIDELNVALYTIGEVGRAIEHADTKAGMLGALLGLVIAGATSQLPQIRLTLAPGDGGLSMALLGMFAVLLLTAGALLGLAQLPRLGTPTNVRWLAFPALAQMSERIRRPSAAELRDEAWGQAEALSRIAVRKFRYLRASMLCSALCVVTFLAWLGALSTLPSGGPTP
jgi:hypothetical protein